ncbi:hypothetical protein BDV95DRAFT_596451 [Massariosphaeria phaeospora]|uniref:Uncharacterized protein n=1 Tax=Massariosphaeria phaeospora TaxID=100035 RepID=A0A7C8I2X3_9PLEO|nr:hypothetical protein BDV95DRAFT_596451 [Massariosphaeria phaeospora]
MPLLGQTSGIDAYSGRREGWMVQLMSPYERPPHMRSSSCTYRKRKWPAGTGTAASGLFARQPKNCATPLKVPLVGRFSTAPGVGRQMAQSRRVRGEFGGGKAAEEVMARLTIVLVPNTTLSYFDASHQQKLPHSVCWNDRGHGHGEVTKEPFIPACRRADPELFDSHGTRYLGRSWLLASVKRLGGSDTMAKTHRCIGQESPEVSHRLITE